MTQKELAIKNGLGENGVHRLVQYENGYRLPKKDLIDKMAEALDMNPYALYDTNGSNATEIMEISLCVGRNPLIPKIEPGQ